MTPSVTICPPGKAYGYDRETLTEWDREVYDRIRQDDYARTVNARNKAVIIPVAGHHIETRDYNGDPT